MLEIRSKAIGNHTYRVRQLGAGEGRKALIRLVKILGPVFAPLLEGSGKVGAGWSFLETKASDVGRAFEVLAERLSDQDLDYFCATFGVCTELEWPDGRAKPLTLQEQELHFAGDYLAMFKWLAFCLEVNYSGFFQSSSALVGALGALDQAKNQGEKVS